MCLVTNHFFGDFKGFVFLVILYLKDFFDFLMNVFNSLRIFTIGSLCKFTAFFSKKSHVTSVI